MEALEKVYEVILVGVFEVVHAGVFVVVHEGVFGGVHEVFLAGVYLYLYVCYQTMILVIFFYVQYSKFENQHIFLYFELQRILLLLLHMSGEKQEGGMLKLLPDQDQLPNLKSKMEHLLVCLHPQEFQVQDCLNEKNIFEKIVLLIKIISFCLENIV